MSAFFITATDTDAGKTFISTQLLTHWGQQGYKTLGFKPIASGCQEMAEGLKNDDALKIMAAANVSLPYQKINPYAFEPAIAPHIAAQLSNTSINIQNIASDILSHQDKADYVLVEGVGGWLVPLNKKETLADLASLLNFPVILVVNLRLGCINHALLTAQAIEQKGLHIAGWIANHSQSKTASLMTYQKENIASLKERLNAPFLGELPYLSTTKPKTPLVLTDFINMTKIENDYA